MSAEAFLTNLKARRPFKDYSASIAYHGEYTHRIQWWILCNYVLPSSGENAKYYEECAYYTCDLTGTNPDRTIYLWDFLFDSASNTTGLTALENAGRNPNNVYTWCRNQAYPLLSRFLSYRMTKAGNYEARITGSSRGSTQAQSDRVAALKIPRGILERAAQRFAGKAFDRLKPEQQTELVDTFLNLGFTEAEV